MAHVRYRPGNGNPDRRPWSPGGGHVIRRAIPIALLLSMAGQHRPAAGREVRIAALTPLSFATASGAVGCDLDGGNEIRRVVRRHINEIKNCYELELQRHHRLSGRAVVRFSLRPNGSVGAATVARSTLGNPVVEACMVAVVRRWKFLPRPDRRGAIVSYPFVLTPRDAPR